MFYITTRTRYNAEGNPLVSVQKLLISDLSDSLESKNLTIDERNLTSTQWVEYHVGTKRKSYNTLPTSNIPAEAVTVDGFTLSQTDNAGVTTTNGRSYTARGMIHTRTDGRGNATTTVTDIAGRVLTVTDAAGHVTTTAYDFAHDQPVEVTDATGNTSSFRYDARGRKVAEWGTALQPACFGYDDADHMVSLTTFRVGDETITSDPSERSDGDMTTWTFHPLTGTELSKTYADNTTMVKTYDEYNRLSTEMDARGNVKSHTYEQLRGLHIGTTYSDGTAPRQFSYNHLGQPSQVTDDAGTRTFGYNSYGERISDSLSVDGDTHLITETQDDFGRSTGYVYSKNGSTQQTVTTGYGADGRINSAGFLHGGAEKQFSYEYMAGSHLLEKLTKPNGMTLTQSYEIQRDLLTGMAYHRGSTLVANRQYSYDALGRPTARSTARKGSVVNDSFTHNSRSELVEAQVNGSNYAYDYDNIGNRAAAVEDSSGVASRTEYTANELNQYTAVGDFQPQFDADGNQTLVKTTTGIWSVCYNAENRPVSFTNSASNTIVECAYDHQGRRCFKKVTTNGTVTLHQRYLYRGYLQIACIDLTRSHHPALWFITWDPTQPVATRPLAIQLNGTWYTYGWDLTKNICELYGTTGYIATDYTYSPYGAVTSSGNVTQPIQWSSEYNDAELALVYYNYRYYNCISGNWLNRDMSENDEYNLYLYIRNRSIDRWDAYGLFLDFLRNSKGELPSFTLELSSPVPVWGGFPFGVIEIGLPKKDCSQDITIAAGINWEHPKFFNKFLPEKITDKVPKMDVSGFFEGKGTYKCGCFSFCEISFGVAGVFGEGRRGGHSSGQKNLQGLDTQYTASAGGSFEVRGTVDLCKGEFNGTYTFVLTMGVKAPGYTVFGYRVNPSFEVSFSEEGNIWNISIPELKLFKPCA